MTVPTEIYHRFQSVAPDGADPAKLQPSKWDDRHKGNGLGLWNVKDFADGVGTGGDDFDAIDGTQAECQAAGGGVVYLPGPTIYNADGIVHRKGVHLHGAGTSSTYLKARAGSTEDAVLLLDEGVVDYADIEDLMLLPNGNAGQRPFYFHARPGAYGNGGWWHSSMRRVSAGWDANRFDAPAWLRGGGDDYQNPIQFIKFDHFDGWGTAAAEALLMTGQVGQVEFILGGLDGPGITGPTPIIRIWRETEDDGLTNLSLSAPYSLAFHGTTLQNCKRAFDIQGALTVEIAVHIENVAQAILADDLSGVTVDNSYFANAGVVGDGSGYIVKAANSSFVIVGDNHIADGAEKDFIAESGAILIPRHNRHPAGTPFVTSGLTGQFSESGGVLNTGEARHALVNTSATNIDTLTSRLAPGEPLYLKAWSGSIKFSSAGNINLSGRSSPVTVPQFGVAMFVKFDLGAGWNLVSVSA